MNLLQKLIAVILTVVIIPIGIIGILATNVSGNALKEQTEQSVAALAAQTSTMVDQEILRLNQLLLQVSISTTFNEVVNNLEADSQMTEQEKASWNLERMKMIKVFDKDIQSIAVSNKLIHSLSIVFVTGDAVGVALKGNNEIPDVRKSKLYNSLLSAKDFSWVDVQDTDLYSDNPHFTGGKALNSSYYTGKNPVAVGIIELNYEEFQKRLESIHIGEQDRSFIVTSNGSIISSLPYDDESVQPYEAVFLNIEDAAKTLDHNTYIDTVAGEEMYITYDRCDQSGFIYVNVIPTSEVLQGSRIIRNVIIAVGVIFAVIAVVFGTFFSVEMTKALRKVEKTMELAAQGDLSVSIINRRKDEIGKVSGSFNTMVASIRDLFVDSKSVADEVRHISQGLSDISEQSSRAASEIATAINDVAQGSGQQSVVVDDGLKIFTDLVSQIKNAVEETETMESHALIVKQYTEEGIDLADHLSTNTRDVAQITETVVREISELGDSILQINDFTQILHELSSQTRLLSLNASIEAARAGENGKGFMVVAEEIRKLAHQSGEQTLLIESVVSRIINLATHSTSTVLDANTLIRKQTESIKASTSYYKKIDESTGALKQSIRQSRIAIDMIDLSKNQVLDSLNTIASVSEAAAASAEQVSAATQEQLSSLEELTSLAFTLNEQASYLNEKLSCFKL